MSLSLKIYVSVELYIFFKTIATKIPTPTVIKYQNTKVIKLAGSKKTNIKLGTFW